MTLLENKTEQITEKMDNQLEYFFADNNFANYRQHKEVQGTSSDHGIPFICFFSYVLILIWKKTTFLTVYLLTF